MVLIQVPMKGRNKKDIISEMKAQNYIYKGDKTESGETYCIFEKKQPKKQILCD